MSRDIEKLIESISTEYDGSLDSSDQSSNEKSLEPKTASYEKKRSPREKKLASFAKPQQTTKSSHSKGQRNRTRAKKQSQHSATQKKELNSLVAWVLNFLFYSSASALILVSVLFVLNNDPEKNLFGYRIYSVLTNSMVPKKGSPPGGFYAGDVILVKAMDGKDAKIGDIITFLPSPTSDSFLTHRVKKKLDEVGGKSGNYLVTRGDANNADDPPIAASSVVGKKMFTIPRLGAILTFIKENFVASSVFLISVFGFILVIRRYL